MRISSFLILIALLAAGCGGAAETPAPNAPAPSASSNGSAVSTEKTVDDFEKRLDGVRTANFSFILVFRRPDGAPLPGEDKRFLKENSPSDVNQWVLTADGKTVIAGTNYKFPPESLEKLKTRFTVEDLSPNPATTPAPDSANAGSGSR